MSQPRVLLLTLSGRTSARGNRYLSGRLGKARLVGFPSGGTDRDGDPVRNAHASGPWPRGGGPRGGGGGRGGADDGPRTASAGAFLVNGRPDFSRGRKH